MRACVCTWGGGGGGGGGVGAASMDAGLSWAGSPPPLFFLIFVSPPKRGGGGGRLPVRIYLLWFRITCLLCGFFIWTLSHCSKYFSDGGGFVGLVLYKCHAQLLLSFSSVPPRQCVRVSSPIMQAARTTDGASALHLCSLHGGATLEYSYIAICST
jgi:hypothetical protein